MPSRFYLPSSGSAPVSPTISGDWEHSNAVRRPTKAWKTGTAIADTSYSPDAADHLVDQDAMFVQFVSDSMLPQVIAGQVKYALQGSETNAGNNCFLTLKIFVCSQDGSTIKETLLAIRRDGTELATAVTNRTDSATLSAATVEEGDRLVFEFGMGGLPVAAGGVQGHNGALRFGDNQATDLAENDTDTGSTSNPWIEFANNIAFVGAMAVIADNGADEADDIAIRRRKASLSTAILMSALSFVPLVAGPAPVDAGIAPTSAGSVPLVQYQSSAGPVLVPAAVPAPDLSAPQYPAYIHARRSHPSRHSPAWQGDRFEAPTPVTAPATPLGRPADVVRKPYRHAVYVPAQPMFGYITSVPVQAWLGRYPDFARRARNVTAQQATNGPIAPIAAAPPASVDAGIASPSAGSVPIVQYQGLAGPFTVATAALDPLTWHVRRIELIAPLQRQPETRTVTPLHVPDVTQPAAALSWTPTYPAFVRGKVGLRTAAQRAYSADRFDAPGAAVVTPLSWKATYPDRAPAARSLLTAQQRAHTADTVTKPAEVTAPALSWRPSYPDRLFTKRWTLTAQQQATAADPTTPTLTPLPTPIRPDFAPARAKVTPATVHAAPLYVPDVTVAAPTRAWAPVYPDWIARKTFSASAQQWTAWHTETPPPPVGTPANVTLTGVYAPSVTLTGISATEVTLTGVYRASVTLTGVKDGD